MSSKSLYILWDESQVWGLLAWRAALGFQLPFKMVRARDIAQGLLKNKPCSLLLVPGGSARHKAEKLGPGGLDAIREYVSGGGNYLGFCGGAGLALSPPQDPEYHGDPALSLALCPWTRAPFAERVQHFMSGHLRAEFPCPEHALSPWQAGRCPAGQAGGEAGQAGARGPEGSASASGSSGPESAASGSGANGAECFESALPAERLARLAPLLPVWWPARFRAGLEAAADRCCSGDVQVLASYGAPGPDFWMADLPIASLPRDAFGTWRERYGVSISPDFLRGEPCVIHGSYGRGGYTLSYSHLETPDSPFANAWLAALLRDLGGLECYAGAGGDYRLPAWDLGSPEALWDDPLLLACLADVGAVLRIGLEQGLLFRRNSWLYGWRSGMPGSALNNLYSVLVAIVSNAPKPEALVLWQDKGEELRGRVAHFRKAASDYLLAERLGQTLAKVMPEALAPGLLKEQRLSLFGPPQRPAGLYSELLRFFEELVWLQF
ncbi:biotin--protein ligase [Desulfovibrio sp. OttesenSCG-928-C14]|nr:biotin--protein ligase [Desulfovibrio sp. OttesenSCG-928-C14]